MRHSSCRANSSVTLAGFLRHFQLFKVQSESESNLILLVILICKQSVFKKKRDPLNSKVFFSLLSFYLKVPFEPVVF